MSLALLLFYESPADAAEAAAPPAGIEGLVVDWEVRGKEPRQRGADTQISWHTKRDLAEARAATSARIICRLDPESGLLAGQVQDAIEGGADELLVPMVRSARDAEAVLALAGGRAGVGILVETQDAVECARDLGALPLTRVYVGLNDLAIDRGSASIFDAVADGTVEQVREAFDVPFGFGGLTLPERGAPIPCRLLIAEMIRLRCSFSFLRRSYRRDLASAGGHGAAAAAIRGEVLAARGRSPGTVQAAHRALVDLIERASDARRAGTG
jgi:hypothetical protein